MVLTAERTLHAWMTPGLMLSQLWPADRDREGSVLDGMTSVLREEFFTCLHISPVAFPGERRAIARTVREEGVHLTVGMSHVLRQDGYNLSSLNLKQRRRTVRAMERFLDEARDTGAASVMVLPGPAPAAEQERLQALGVLAESLADIAEMAAAAPTLRVLIEPMDVQVHKKGTLGYINEAASLMKRLQADYDHVGLCLDTSHTILNGETVGQALRRVGRYAEELHLCNCVIDVTHPLYGDAHLPFGPPGVLDQATIASIMTDAVDVGFLSPRKKSRLCCEVLCPPDQTPEDLIRSCRRSLEQAWAASCETAGS